MTSSAGAALRDMLHVIERRAPWTRLVLRHARVQGEGAAEHIAAAIDIIARCSDAEVLIVGRGGGSIEDLWAFNEEAVARAIAACPIPVISAVGHETDITISDLIADLRAPTPSAAAERAVPDVVNVAQRLDDQALALRNSLLRSVDRRRVRLDSLVRGLTRGGAERIRDRRERTARIAARLEALSPLGALARGYAVPQGGDGSVLRSIDDFTPSHRFRLRVRDGVVDCRVEDVRRTMEEE